MGTKVGPWAVRLLATRDQELCDRLAVLRDSDKRLDDAPAAPVWLTEDAHDPEVVKVVHSHPTLEPSITPGNEDHVTAVLEELRLDLPDTVSLVSIHELFHSARVATKDRPAMPAGAGSSRKGEFALALAARLADKRRKGALNVAVPVHITEIFEFLYEQTPRPDRHAASEAMATPTSAAIAQPEEPELPHAVTYGPSSDAPMPEGTRTAPATGSE